MTAATRERLRQRADYTHKFNASAGRHGWLRLTPAYSVKIVEELLDRYRYPIRVLDPFCGTATTALCASYRGLRWATTDINPFLVWLGRAKTASYSESSVAEALRAGARAAEAAEQGAILPAVAPRLHNVHRWWPPRALDFLCALRAGIELESEEDSPKRALLLVAFCRTVVALSNAAFNHQSMSFRDDRQLAMPLGAELAHMFGEHLRFVAAGARINPTGKGQVVLADSRRLHEAVDGPFDLVVTSPPYANRMSYIRELRPYMYWLGYLDSGRAAGELDWSAIGGTWGVATSRLCGWRRPRDRFEHPELDNALDRISHCGAPSAEILANYIAKYMDDMWAHFAALVPLLNGGCAVHYIVGNSTFYGVLLPVEKLFAAMLRRLGFEHVGERSIRKRNSKKELFEFDVSGRWPGVRA